MANEAVFLDTLGLVGFLNRSDVFHQQAVTEFHSFRRDRRPLFVTSTVLSEVGNSLSRGSVREIAAEFLDSIWFDPRVTVIQVDRSLFLAGVSRFRQAKDKSWGLVDCISFEVMASAGIRDAFTADRHFEQAGFNCLLRVPQ